MNLSQWSISLALGFICGCGQPAAISQLAVLDASQRAKDYLQAGHLAFDAYDFAVPAAVDSEISPLLLGDEAVATDIRGRLFLPRTPAAVPLLLFLHGNHETCGRLPDDADDPRIDDSSEFSLQGRCPDGKIEVPSYRGFDAQATLLASHGFAVVSINANRGINGLRGQSLDENLVYARGLLVLKHLEALQKWSQLPEVPSIGAAKVDLRQRLDWNAVGLMGHSRGGEGVRFAYQILNQGPAARAWQERLPQVKIRGIFEVGPVDEGMRVGTELHKANALGTAWAVLIPGCDSDVSDFSGARPFQRMLNQADGTMKAVYTLWGANHNFFNSEWHLSDAPHSCLGLQQPLWDTSGEDFGDGLAKRKLRGSAVQQATLKALLLGFFRAHLKAQREGEQLFDPQYHLPDQLSQLAPSSREYLRADASISIFAATSPAPEGSPELKVENLPQFFSEQLENLAALREAADTEGYSRIHAHLAKASSERPAWVLSPQASLATQAYTIPLQRPYQSAGFWTLDLVLAQQEFCDPAFGVPCGSQGPASFQVALEFVDGSSSRSVAIWEYISLKNYYGRFFREGREWTNFDASELNIEYDTQPTLYQTARIELKDFGPINQPVRGVKFIFPPHASYSILLQDLRLSRSLINHSHSLKPSHQADLDPSPKCLALMHFQCLAKLELDQ